MLVLDTNILIALQKSDARADALYRAAVATGERIAVPAVVRYEARRGLLKAEHSARLLRLERLLDCMEPLNFDDEAADIAAHIYHQLRVAGQTIDDPDLMIAATALRHQAALVTRNTRHFQRIPNLTLLDWL